MAHSLETLDSPDGRIYSTRHGVVAIATFDTVAHEYVLRFEDDVLGWGERRFQGLETCDWTALAYAAELTATGH